MNAANGSAKVDAMAIVINELVSQRTLNEQKMMTMHSSMMQHMGSHMTAAGQGTMNCPMIDK
jgi:hypothetical protein